MAADAKRVTGGRYECDVLHLSDVERLMIEKQCYRFDELCKHVSTLIAPRPMGVVERMMISDALRERVVAGAVAQRQEEDNGHRGVLIYTAFTTDYNIGRLVDTVNRAYADKHGYHYINRILSYEDMLATIAPRKKHCTWYKVWLLNELLNNKEMIREKEIQYIMWIDADAVVINDTVRVEDIIARGGHRDLIIAENMHAGCLINAWVFLVR